VGECSFEQGSVAGCLEYCNESLVNLNDGEFFCLVSEY
jgi:hypothetical protein